MKSILADANHPPTPISALKKMGGRRKNDILSRHSVSVVGRAPESSKHSRKWFVIANLACSARSIESGSSNEGWLTHSLRPFVRVGLASLPSAMASQSASLTRSLRSLATGDMTIMIMTGDIRWLARSLASLVRWLSRPSAARTIPPHDFILR
jgi:hypothetical protein